MTGSRLWVLPAFLVLSVAAGCGADESDDYARSRAAADTAARTAVTTGTDPYGSNGNPSLEELERGRLDGSWKQVVQLDAASNDTVANPERWEDIVPEHVNEAPMHLPLSGDVAGPSVFRAQVPLDRAQFSPGILDGYWGKNTEKAVYWLQQREGLPATGQLDADTFERLLELAGRPARTVMQHRLAEEEVAGPFVEIPDDIYEKAKMECMCYESLSDPTGKFEVNSITEDPWWHYQPDLLADVDDSKPDAKIPPGPNNAVGKVWMDLSKPHYGIHGTSAPETIGYVTSAGCVRLTNWDALFLARRIQSSIPVQFIDS